MTKFKFNARFFGGGALLIIFLLVFVPSFLFLQSDREGSVMGNLIDPSQEPLTQETSFGLLFGISVGAVVVLFIISVQKKRNRRS